MLPFEWWKLSLIWLTSVKSRTPPARKSLLLSSFRTAVIGLALSVAALSVTLAIFTGFKRVLARSISDSLGHVTYFTGWHTQEEMDRIALAAPAGALRAVYFWTSQGLIVGPQGGRGVLMEGRAGTGTPVPPGSPVLMELGRPLAEMLGLKPGDKFRVLLPGIVKGSVEAQLTRVLEFGMHDLDSRLAVVIDESLRPIMAARDPQAFLDRPGDAHGIRFFLDPRGHEISRTDWVEKWRDDFSAAIAKKGLDEKNSLLRTWKELQRNLMGAIELDKRVLTIVIGLLTLVATLNIAATLVVLFLERDRETAVLRAIGLSPRGLRAWIGIQGFLMGLVAATLGLAAARIFGMGLQRLPIAELPADIYHIARLPLAYEPLEQGLIFAFGVATSVFTAWILARRLSQTHPLSSLGQRR